MNYTVKYKKANDWFWRKIKNVKGDGILENNSHRYLILDNEERIEIPLFYIFKFSKERFFVIKKNMEQESGQQIRTVSKIDK